MSIRVGIGGLGRLGRRHAENLAHRVRGAELVAACSFVEQERSLARRDLGVSEVYPDFDTMVSGAELDLIWIATPTHLHEDHVVRALETGAHVFCEKPLALTVEGCNRVTEVAATRPDQLVAVGFMRRYDPRYAWAKRRLEEGAIGEPFMVRSHSADMNETASFQIEYSRTSGGYFVDTQIHDVDLARWFLQSEVEECWAAGGAYVHHEFGDHGDIDNAVSVCRFASGAVASLTLSRTAHHAYEVHTEIFGSEGQLQIGAGPGGAAVAIGDAAGLREPLPRNFFDRFEEAFLHEAEDVVDCIRTGRAPRASLEDATEATRVALAITTAYREGRIVQVERAAAD